MFDIALFSRFRRWDCHRRHRWVDRGGYYGAAIMAVFNAMLASLYYIII